MAVLLVIGGAGYVGSHAVKALTRAGHKCVVFDNLSRGHREFVRWSPLIVGDLRDGAALKAAFTAYRFDAVLHFGALAYVGESVTEPDLYYDVNVGGTLALMRAMVEANVLKLVFSSTCAVYGAPAQMPITEDTPLAPVNPYGFTKRVCEQMMQDFDTAYGLRSIRLRYFNAAGGDPECEIGERHEPETHLIPLVLDAAAGRRASISILGTDYPTPDGTAVRDYVHTTDLVDAHLKAVDSLIGGGSSWTLNLGTSAGMSVREIIEAARRVTNRKIAVVESPRRLGDPPILVADPSRVRAVLGWQAEHSDIDTIIADAWRWRLQETTTTALTA
jgi:UDP-glucose-4-epimerase GalE